MPWGSDGPFTEDERKTFALINSLKRRADQWQSVAKAWREKYKALKYQHTPQLDEEVTMSEHKEEEWKWFGDPQHNRMARYGCWHLGTLVGDGRYIVSSVGCFHSTPDVRERTTENMTTVDGANWFETKVFRAIGGKVADLSSIDECRYDTEEHAEQGHLRICRHWERKAQEHTQAKLEKHKRE